jgi:hypothetical protein
MKAMIKTAMLIAAATLAFTPTAKAFDKELVKDLFLIGLYDTTCQPLSPKLKQFNDFAWAINTQDHIQEQRQAVTEAMLKIKPLSDTEFCAKYKPNIDQLESRFGG